MRFMVHSGCGHLVLHPVVLGSHGDRLRMDAVSEVLPPAFLGRQMLGKLTPGLDRLALTARIRYNPFDVLSPDLCGIVADADDVGLPVQADIGDARLSPQGLLDSGSATEAVHAVQLERGVLHGRCFRALCWPVQSIPPCTTSSTLSLGAASSTPAGGGDSRTCYSIANLLI